jgi:CheY-like chemotaxis protein
MNGPIPWFAAETSGCSSGSSSDCGPARAREGRTETLMDSQRTADGRPEAFRAPYRILVVDDNKDAAESLQMLLRLLGSEVRTAYDGLRALELAEQFLPHAVVLDIGLPKLDGFHAARLIRAQEWGQSMVLVAVSGWCRDVDREQSLNAGFDGHLAKPVRVEELRNLIQSLLDGALPKSV